MFNTPPPLPASNSSEKKIFCELFCAQSQSCFLLPFLGKRALTPSFFKNFPPPSSSSIFGEPSSDWGEKKGWVSPSESASLPPPLHTPVLEAGAWGNRRAAALFLLLLLLRRHSQFGSRRDQTCLQTFGGEAGGGGGPRRPRPSLYYAWRPLNARWNFIFDSILVFQDGKNLFPPFFLEFENNFSLDW